MNYIAWRKPAILIVLAALGLAALPAPSVAASSQSNFCRSYAEDYARRYSAGGAMGGVALGAARGRPSAMRGLHRRWLFSQAYKNCMNGQWP